MADLREELVDALAQQIGVPTFSPGEAEAVVALAAVAAHARRDRTAAPLVSFLAGVKAARLSAARPVLTVTSGPFLKL